MKHFLNILLLALFCCKAVASENDSIKILAYKYENDTLRYSVYFSGSNISNIKTFLYTSNWSKMMASDSIDITNGSDTVAFTLIPLEGLASGVNYNLSVDLFSPEGVKLKNHIITVTYTKVVNVTHTVYYVSVNDGNDTNDGKATNKAFKSLQKAANVSNPGDTVLVMNGTYATADATILTVNISGIADNWITYKAYPGHAPKIKISGSVWNGVIIDANYIVFEGFDLEGNSENLTLADAEAAEAEAESGGTDWWKYGNYNTNGLLLGGNNSKGSHHITVRNCKIHDFPGAGIAGIRIDYVTVENCTAYNNAWYTMYAGSGISIWHLFNSDNKTSYKNFIRNNITYNNKTLVKWVSIGSYSDGNGIILDDNLNTQAGALGSAYTGRTLIENNLSFNNGGSGIHAFSSQHVDLINNTTYHNGTQVGYGELFAGACTDVKIYNNIMYARKNGKVNENYNNKNVVYSNNIMYNGTVAVKGSTDLVADPLFVNTSTDPEVADFSLQEGSPAIDFGNNELFAVKDILGVERPLGTGVDAGAYESPFANAIGKPVTVSEINIYPNPAVQLLNVVASYSDNIQFLHVYNQTGALVLNQITSGQTHTVDISALSAGVYFVKVSTGQGMISKTFIKK